MAAQPRHVTIQNLAPHPRQEWFCVAVPFAKAEVAGLPDLHVEGHHTVWQPFGARWPDGSLRQALCLFRPTLPAGGEAELALVAGPGPSAEVEPGPDLSFELDIVVQVGGTEHRARPRLVRLLEINAARKVALLRCRVGGTGLVFELILEQYTGQEHVGADLALFFSDPTSADMQRRVDKVSVECRGAALVLRHQKSLGVETEIHDAGSDVVLLAEQILADGQGVRRTGVVVPPLLGDNSLRDRTILAAIAAPPLGATDWQSSGAFGPFGLVPPVPPWLRHGALRATLAGRHQKFVQQSQRAGGPFHAFTHGLAKNASQTGGQEDFGVAKMEAVAATGIPSFLAEVELSVLQEGCRPVHNFEEDGTPVLARKHPNWVVWSGRTHWHCQVSTDRLGKPCPVPRFESHGWSGKDRQHWSSLYLTAFYLLTGKHWALREIENEVQLYLAAQTVREGLTTSGPGAPRGAGRVLLTACWLYLCTGDADLLQRMHDRIDKVYAGGWFGSRVPEGKVRTFEVSRPDARMLQGKTEYWTPWQDALAAVGFAAFYRLTGDETAGEIADALALNTLRYGWRVEERQEPIIATALRWNADATPLTEAEVRSNDPTTVLWSHGTAFSVWAIGAVELARQAALRTDDQPMLARAEKILHSLRSRRQAPSDRWFDRFGEWDAVR